ncbi:MAG: T9SS type A sorting domain-containing protein [Flavobacterium sp.]|uniref:T9SS-dependent choice-of-anchor J family protein n=1 Tax=Flavobacterium sp. TaxID=239 RepID=UPI00122A014B|nr:choice-of-anchor J domain-containing protein [Flavobacterium sp.]RZJ66461.1 MAG: T9SS type A sorting domain-containing protein [Flavobacterium sp.]
MKKILLTFSLLVAAVTANAQTNLLTENFDALGDPVTLPTGWTQTNQSAPTGTLGWFRGGAGTTFAGYNGGQTGYAGANFNSTTGTGVISTWLMSPVLNLMNGDVISFYTRTATGSIYADNLELRVSTNGAASVNPAGPTGLGDYTTLGVTVNTVFPTASGYPQVWTQYTYTVAGLSAPTDARFAFRYTVPTSAGPSGNNSNFIGVDAVSVDRPTAGASDFFKSNISMYPNPAREMLNLSVTNGSAIQNVQISDLNGRIVKSVDFASMSDIQLVTSDLAVGAYTISVKTEDGSGVSKFLKH